MKTSQLFLFALALTVSSSAYADTDTAATTATDSSGSMNYYSAPPQTATTAPKKKKRKKKPSPDNGQAGVQELTLPMSKGELEAEVSSDVAQRERANAPRTYIGFDVSSWSPKNLTLASNLTGTTTFATKGIPAMDLGFFTPVIGRQLNMEFGLGFLALQRTGTLVTSGINIPQTQNGYATTIRAGVEYTPWTFLDDKLIPYAEGLLLPTLFLASASAFDAGDSLFGVPVSLGVGTIYRFNRTFGLDIGIAEEIGSVQGASYAGFGVHGGVRFQL